MSIFTMADLCHLEFYASNIVFFEKLMYDFLQIVNRDHSPKLLSFRLRITFLLHMALYKFFILYSQPP